MFFVTASEMTKYIAVFYLEKLELIRYRKLIAC